MAQNRVDFPTSSARKIACFLPLFFGSVSCDKNYYLTACFSGIDLQKGFQNAKDHTRGGDYRDFNSGSFYPSFRCVLLRLRQQQKDHSLRKLLGHAKRDILQRHLLHLGP
ncbi:hypothetical protein PXK28_07165 [Phaeobacter gallaeciensis]|uniref:hypothetical protein n=1 Tax=Phaeobacter gallaeciensis TaxID=60890 RepID=UPI00237F5F0F|nr:hypothetical protein [Phaeobacter gallaeciensis]MDE4405688.1 hypothetical protein [Phaeobacter gallaeciensis]